MQNGFYHKGSGRYKTKRYFREIKLSVKPGAILPVFYTGLLRKSSSVVINQGFVNAVDSWQMGWKDLASYREWAKNPALAHLKEEDIPPVSGVQNVSHSRAIVDKSCTRCGKRLSQNEVDLLKAIPDFNHSKLSYCFEHLPDHFKRRIDPFILQRYTDQMNS